MKKLPKTILIPGLLGLILLLAGDLYNSAGFLVCVLGCALLLFAWLRGIWHFSGHKSPKIRKITKIVKFFTFAALFVILVSFFWIEGLILAHDDGTEAPTAQTIIVLGAGIRGDQPSLTLKTRLETALDYLNANPEAQVIVSGGQGADEICPESYVMADWLESRGISSGRIWIEERSTDTRENLIYSKEYLEKYDLPGPVAIVSSSFHLYRAQKLAEQVGLENVQTLSAPVPDVPLQWLTSSVYLREYCSILLMLARSIF